MSTYFFSNDPDTRPLSLRTKPLLIFGWLMLSFCHLKPYIFLKCKSDRVTIPCIEP